MNKYILGIVSIFVISGCGEWISHLDKPTKEVRYAFDVVKNISVSNKDLQDSNTYSSDVFEVSSESRLMLALTHLADHAGRVKRNDQNRVWAQISVVDENQKAKALASLKLCGITRSWMLFANWERAHPFGRQGLWARGGGDYSYDSCVNAVDLNFKSESNSAKLSQVLSFDVTSWFEDYVAARKQYYGLILISDESIKVGGNNHSNLYPRIFWME